VIDEANIDTISFQYSGLNNNIKYFWRVRSSNSISWSDVWNFTTIIGSPILTNPLDEASDVSIQEEFSWDIVLGAEKYWIQISKNVNFSNIVVDEKDLESVTFSTDKLIDNTEYLWRVKALNSVSTSEWSEIYKFKTHNKIVLLSEPANNSLGIPINGTLTWDSYEGVDSYYLQVSEDVSFSTTKVDAKDILVTSFDYSDFLHSIEYFWRVKAIFSDDETDWSNVFKFKTILAAPELTAPDDEQIDIPVNVSLTWDSVNEAETYSLHVSENSDFTSLFIEESEITETSFWCEELNENTVYYWRTNATNEGGTSSWSALRQFTTETVSNIDQKTDQVLSLRSYPNPFWNNSNIVFSLSEASNIKLSILNIFGDEIESIVNAKLEAGNYHYTWNASEVNNANGFYICRLIAGKNTVSVKLFLIR